MMVTYEDLRKYFEISQNGKNCNGLSSRNNISRKVSPIDFYRTTLFILDSIKQLLGYTPEDVLYTNVQKFICPDDLAYFMKKWHALLKVPQGHVSAEFRVKHKNGSWAWIEATGINHLQT